MELGVVCVQCVERVLGVWCEVICVGVLCFVWCGVCGVMMPQGDVTSLAAKC